MTLREAVADRAKWLDVEVPGWERRIPGDAEIDMESTCAPCIADYVFKIATCSALAISPVAQMEGWEYLNFEIGAEGWPRELQRAFRHGGALPMWREEIAARGTSRSVV